MKPLQFSEEQQREEFEEAIISDMNLSYYLDSKEFLKVCYENSEFVKGSFFSLSKSKENDLIYKLIKQLHDENQYVDIRHVQHMLKNAFVEKESDSWISSNPKGIEIKDDDWFSDKSF